MWATIDGESAVTIVVLGEDEAHPLLGAYALEGLNLAMAPEARRTTTTHMIPYQEAAAHSLPTFFRHRAVGPMRLHPTSALLLAAVLSLGLGRLLFHVGADGDAG